VKLFVVVFYIAALLIPGIGASQGNQAPQANNDTSAVAESGLVTIDVLANDADPDGSINANSIVIFQPDIEVYQPVSGWLRLESDGRITYGHYGGPSSSDAFFYVVADDNGSFSEPAMVSITIGDSNSNVPAPVEPEEPSEAPTMMETPVMEVSEENVGSPASSPSGLSAFHRDGQTFLTWEETSALDGYHVYRHSAPINTSNISAARKVTSRWGPLGRDTSVNSHGSPEAPRNFVIQDLGAALSDDTGLFVYTTQAGDSATAYYAVTGVANGVESLATLTTLSSPVNESVRAPRDVLTVSINGGKGRLYRITISI